MTTPTYPTQTLQWQPERHLKSGDKIWILTDIQTVWSGYFDYSADQELFRVGIYDLTTGKIGFGKFGRDIAHAFLKASIQPAPWRAPLPCAVEIHRQSHGNTKGGRFRTWATLIDVDPQIIAIAPLAQKKFVQEGHDPTATVGMWSDLEARAKRELAVEKAALAMVGIFKASDVRKIVGNINVSPVLRDLVEEGRLVRVGAKKYMVAPPHPLPQRLDWTG